MVVRCVSVCGDVCCGSVCSMWVSLSVCLSVCAGELEEAKDCDCEGGLTVHADVLEQEELQLWEP